MDKETDEELIKRCRKLIEERLGWGDPAEWSTADYDKLSGLIRESTRVNLSVATLKRLWGKIRYDSKPTATTLNTLAQYIGFENWRSFSITHRVNGNGHSISDDAHVMQPRRGVALLKNMKVLLVIVGVVGIVVVLFLIPWSSTAFEEGLNPSLFEFSSKKIVDEGVPNTVVFDYNAMSAETTDSVYIQQSWDSSLSRKVDRGGRQHTSIYYYPGFFEAKLVINDQIVKEHDLLIKTRGWLPLIEQAGVPVYFEERAARADTGVLRLSVNQMLSNHIALQPVTPWTAFYNVREFGVKSDDVIVESQLRNEFGQGAGACQFVEIRLQFEGPAVLIPLCTPGCVSEISFGDTSGKKQDMSPFGCDFSAPVNVRCQMKDEIGEIFINQKKAIRFRLNGATSSLVGLAFRFQGTGSVDFVRVSDGDGIVKYEDSF